MRLLALALLALPALLSTGASAQATLNKCIDAQGKVAAVVRYGSGAEALRHDLKLLLAENPA